MWLDKENEDEQNNQQPDSLNSPSVGAGAGSAQLQPSTTPTGGTPSSLTPTNQPSTQKFGTIQDYFKGNQNQGEKLGEQFTSKLADTQQKQRDTIGQTAQQVTGDAAANTIGFDQDLVSSAVSDPTQVAGNEDLFGKFSQQWNAAYKGPESFESSEHYGKAAEAAQKAAEKQAQATSTGGRQQLIQDEFGVYGQGNKGLDEALLQQSSYFPKVQEQAKEFGTVQDYLKQQSEQVGQAAQAAKATTEATKAQTQGAFEGALTGFQTDLNKRTGEAQKTAQQDLERYTNALASGDSAQIESVLAETNVDPDTAKSIQDYLAALNTNYSIKPSISSAYIGNPNTAINPTTVAERSDYERAAALEKLTGKDFSGVLQQSNIDQAGTGTLAKHALKGQDLKQYLQSGLATQDKSLLATAPKLDWNAINAGSVDPKTISKQVSDLVAAGQRQGVNPNENTALKSLESNAMQGIQAIILGGENINTRPALKTYTDAVVEMKMAAGQDRAAAQNSINEWIGQLAGQIGRPGVPVYTEPAAPKDPEPQINPGLQDTPKKNVMRSFNRGGLVQSTLHDYFKQNKR